MKVIRVSAFILVGIMLFLLIQYVLTPDGSTIDNYTYTLQGIDRIDKDTIDVVFLGASHMQLGMSPMKIYEDTGICAYSLATSGQPIPASYYVLNQELKRQSPSLVVLDAGRLFYNPDEDIESWRRVIDGLGGWPPNIEMAVEFGKRHPDEGALSALVPLLKYHSSWADITPKVRDLKEDDDIYYSAGEYIISVVAAAGTTREAMNGEARDRAAMIKGTTRYYDQGSYGEEEFDSVVYAPQIGECEKEWLLKIKQLCDENGAQLLLTKIPVQISSTMYPSAWTEIRSDMVRSLAGEVGIPFFDLTYDVESSVDFTTDTYDYGKHLNIRGAEKDAAALGAYLQENYNIQPQDNEQFNDALEQYRKVREVAFLQSETDFKLYLDRLKEGYDKWSVLLSVQEQYTSGMNEEDYANAGELGLKLISEGNFLDSYLAVILSGEVEHEEVSDRKIEYSTKINNMTVQMMSSGYLTGLDVLISMDDEDYALHGRGLNIVVIDNETGLVIDSVSFDTMLESKPASRNWVNTDDYLRSYEAAVCFK